MTQIVSGMPVVGSKANFTFLFPAFLEVDLDLFSLNLLLFGFEFSLSLGGAEKDDE